MFGKLRDYLEESPEEAGAIVKDAVMEYASIVELLLSAGADPNLVVRYLQLAQHQCFYTMAITFLL